MHQPPDPFRNFRELVYARNEKGQIELVLWSSERRTRKRRWSVQKGSYWRGTPDERSRDRRDPKNPKVLPIGFIDSIEQVRRRKGSMKADEVEYFRKVIEASLSEAVYLKANEHSFFLDFSGFYDPHSLNKEENYKYFRVAWMLCFVGLVRPDEIKPKTASRTDRHQIMRIEKTFIGVPEGPQKKIIRQLFDSDMPLEEIGKSGRIPGKEISPEDKDAFIEMFRNPAFRGRTLAEALTAMDVKYWSPKTPSEAYLDDPAQFSRDTFNLRKRVKIQGVRVPASKSPSA